MQKKYNNSGTRHKLLLKLIKERGAKCQDTGALTSKSGIKYSKIKPSEIGNYLILHEIDGNKKNLDPSNLLILCKSANLRRRFSEGRFRFNRLKGNALALDQYKYGNTEKLNLVNESMK